MPAVKKLPSHTPHIGTLQALWDVNTDMAFRKQALSPNSLSVLDNRINFSKINSEVESPNFPTFEVFPRRSNRRYRGNKGFSSAVRLRRITSR